MCLRYLRYSTAAAGRIRMFPYGDQSTEYLLTTSCIRHIHAGLVEVHLWIQALQINNAAAAKKYYIPSSLQRDETPYSQVPEPELGPESSLLPPGPAGQACNSLRSNRQFPCSVSLANRVGKSDTSVASCRPYSVIHGWMPVVQPGFGCG